jgi:hypothetical protein
MGNTTLISEKERELLGFLSFIFFIIFLLTIQATAMKNTSAEYIRKHFEEV